MEWGRAKFLLFASLSEIQPPKAGGFACGAEVRAVALFAFCAMPKACVAVSWVGIELLLS